MYEMPSSELSDALNPYASQTRQRTSVTEYQVVNHSQSFHPVVQPPQQHVPHVSELAMAMAEPALPPTPRTRQGAHFVTELFRMMTANQHAQEIERKRRLAWEQEQEAKQAQKQAEMDRRLLDMFSELTALRSTVNTLRNSPVATSATHSHSPGGLVTPQYTMSPPLPQQVNPYFQPASPISPVAQPTAYPLQPMFVQGSSNSPLPGITQAQSTHYRGHVHGIQPTPHTIAPQMRVDQPPQHAVHTPHQSVTPNPSPQLTFVETSTPTTSSPRYTHKRKKKLQQGSVHSSDDENNTSSSSDSSRGRPRKRKSHHDTKCYTIHHAMRIHLLHMMDIETDRELPDSHTEGELLETGDPVRFVWDKTTKQSVHNARMKTRVVEAIKQNRRIYGDVDHKDFGKKNLGAAFEQCFTTLRQKYKVQRDTMSAQTHKKREDNKARKARHLSRRKIKLSNRADARLKIQIFEHVTFDGALQLECMSSEESDFELDPQSSQACSVLRTHGYAWRSTRLLRFYSALDDEERQDSSTKPKRGLGKKERRVGPPKEEFTLPPQGVATWMISQRWYKASMIAHPDLPDVLNKLIIDPLGFNWAHFHDLGEDSAESEDEVQQQPAMQTFNSHMHMAVPQQHQQHHYAPGTYMSYTI